MQIVFQIIWTVIGAFLSVILTKLLIQNGKYIRQNQELIRQNQKMLQQNQELIKQHWEDTKQNQRMIKKLIELVDARTEMLIRELKR